MENPAECARYMAKLELFSLIENSDLMKLQFLRKSYTEVKSLEVSGE
jgi:hypothetical protein